MHSHQISTLFLYTTLFRSDAHHEGDAINLPEGANLEKVDDGFEVTGITTDKAYKVTYQTKVKDRVLDPEEDRKSTRLNSSHVAISYAVFCLKKKNEIT